MKEAAGETGIVTEHPETGDGAQYAKSVLKDNEDKGEERCEVGCRKMIKM